MSPRLTDWTLALTVGGAFATGIVSLVSGEPGEWFVFIIHGMFGLWLLLVVGIKVRRVWPRLLRRRLWEWRTLLGVLALCTVLLTLLLGIGWSLGSDLVLANSNLLNWHIGIGIVLTLAVSLHMVARAKPLRARDVQGRRTLLRAGAIAAGGVVLWPTLQLFAREADLPGTRRRFTGSREALSFQGNVFPTSSWVADQPHPLDRDSWRLRVTGAIHTPLVLTFAELDAAADTMTATLDCTGGFYSTQHWQGMQVGRLLAQAGLRSDARYVSFISVTGYRWSLPIAEARDALLATKVADAWLAHDHGAPARLVAPGRRGFEWVKWLSEIHIITEPDAGQLVAIFSSSFTPAGRGT